MGRTISEQLNSLSLSSKSSEIQTPSNSLREQLIAEGVIRPVEAFKAKAEALNAAYEKQQSTADKSRHGGEAVGKLDGPKISSGGKGQQKKKPSRTSPNRNRSAILRAPLILRSGYRPKQTKIVCPLCGLVLHRGEMTSHKIARHGESLDGATHGKRRATYIRIVQGGSPGLRKRQS
ncbi:MAG: hypothetical protein FHP94_03175 [Denitromonas halophila]|nr:MAG: hypothetical protein FHP94_03175 [Denitromonas halophila]TVT72858.1 MAG: hypothetical protein FHP93_07675 [Denitromonas halophila]